MKTEDTLILAAVAAAGYFIYKTGSGITDTAQAIGSTVQGVGSGVNTVVRETTQTYESATNLIQAGLDTVTKAIKGTGGGGSGGTTVNRNPSWNAGGTVKYVDANTKAVKTGTSIGGSYFIKEGDSLFNKGADVQAATINKSNIVSSNIPSYKVQKTIKVTPSTPSRTSTALGKKLGL